LVAIVLTFTAVWLTVLASAHYAAPVTALLFALYFQCVRHLRVLLRRRRALFQLFVAVFLAFWIAQLADSPRFHAARVPEGDPHHYSLLRARMMERLAAEGGRHLVVVPWDNRTSRVLTWVKNPADIDDAAIVWAWQGVGLLERFGDRRVWLLDETRRPPQLIETEPADLVWSLRTRDGAAASLHRGGADGSLRVEITALAGGTDAPEAAALLIARSHPGLRSGDRWTVRLRARADRERPLAVRIARGDGRPIEGPGLLRELSLDPEWRVYELVYTAPLDLDHVGLELWLGASTAAVEVGEVAITRVEGAPAGTDPSSPIE
jgi:hypothetical protein